MRIDTELRLAFRPYFEDGTLPIEHTTDTRSPVYHIPETTDELLAWLPIPDHSMWVMWYWGTTSQPRVMLVDTVLSTEDNEIELGAALGASVLEAILRCWLAWKASESEVRE